jgi:DNA-binding transcriptional MerR regulator
MSSLPKLPSAVASATLPETSSGVTVEALTTEVVQTVKLDGPGFKARDVISKADRAEREDFAIKLVRDPDFNAAWLANLARHIDLNTGPLETVLEKTRALDVGELGDLTVKAARYMQNMGKLPPAPNAKFMAKVKSGEAKAEEMIDMAKVLYNGIQHWLDMRNNMLKPFIIVRTELGEKYDQMAEAIVLNALLAKNEDERTITLTQDSALLEFASIHLPDRIKELQDLYKNPGPKDDREQIKQEVQRLTGLANVLIKIISDINPMILAGNAAVGSYLDLSNMAGGRAATLGLFLSAGIARWESDVVKEILALQQIAAGFALAKVEDLMNAQSQRTGETMKAAATQYVEMMDRWMTTAETMEKITADTLEVKDILVKGFAQLVSKHQNTARVVQQAKDSIDAKNDEFATKMIELAETGVIK